MESRIYFLVMMSVSLALVTSVTDELHAIPPPLTDNEEQIVSTSECDSGQCEVPSDKATSTDLGIICQDSEQWGEMSGCFYGGSNFSVSWCPKYIRNNTIYKDMKIRLNWFKTTYSFNKGQQSVTAMIPGFKRPIFKKTFNENCEHFLGYLPPMAQALLKLKCPFSSEQIQGVIGMNFTIPNQLATIVPAGSYHLFANVTNENNALFLCLDGWLEFGL